MRAKKTTARQFEIMIRFIEKNKFRMEGKLSEKNTAKEKDDLWAELTELLNAEGLGPQKSAEKWRKTWQDFKCEVKAKGAAIKKYETGTGGGPSLKDKDKDEPPTTDTLTRTTLQPLTPLQELALAMIDPILIEGDRNVNETARYEENSINDEIATVHTPALTSTPDISLVESDLLNNIEPELPTASSSQTSNRDKKRSHKRILTASGSSLQPLPKVAKRHFNDLVQTEDRKTEVLHELAVAVERKNGLTEEALQLKKKELELKEMELNVQEQRNQIFRELNDTLVNIANAFLDKLN